jgi:excisionase family DNA binding protein
MHRRLQFGMRENPASNGRHGSRVVLGSVATEDCITNNNLRLAQTSPAPDHSVGSTLAFPDAASAHAATGGEKSTTNARDTARMPIASQAATSSEFEPLIGSSEAARLLGDIHVKTLQRYARHGNVPGYQIGGHWYFRASELDSWLRSRLNSSCHPCRSNEEAK